MRYLSLLFLISLTIHATEEMRVLEVSTGTRTSKILSEAPIKTELVTSKEIEDLHAKDVSEAIKNIPGLFIKETHGKQGQSVWIQGFNSDRVLVLIDGEPMTSATGQTADLSQLSTSDIQSIEIIKGASSALYGSQAMGGVINIITKKAKKGFHNKVTMEVGTFGNKNAEENKPSTLVNGSSSYNSGKHVVAAYINYIYDSGVKLQDGYTYDLPQRDKITLSGEYRYLGDTEFYIKPLYFYEKDNKPYSTYIPGIGDREDKRVQEVNKYRLSVGSKTKFDNDDTLKSSFFAERFISDSYDDIAQTTYMEKYREAIIDMAQADIQYDTLIGESHLITTGLQFRYQQLEQNSFTTNPSGTIEIDELIGEASSHASEGYIQDDWFVTDSLELIPGVRYQYDSDFGSYVSPKISLLYTPYLNGNNRLNIRASYGNGYRVPSLKERYFSFDQSQYGIIIQGNPDLEPESSKSYQLSSEWLDATKYSLALNLFYNDVKNLIDVVKNKSKSKPGLDIYEYTNIGEALTMGAEFVYSFEFLKNYSLAGGYTYLYSKDKITKKHLTSRPENQIKTTLAYNTKKTNAQINIVYESEEYVDEDNEFTSSSQTQIDIKMTRHVTKLFSIYGGINNLLNEVQKRFDDNDERSKRPRYFYIGTTYNF